MRLTITNDFGDLSSLEIPDNSTISALKIAIESKQNPANSSGLLLHNGQILQNLNNTLSEYNIIQDDIILYRRTSSQAAPTPPGPSNDQYELMRLQILSNPTLLSQLMASNPTLANSIQNPNLFKQLVMQSLSSQNEDQFDVETQRKIEEQIKQQNIQENLSNAMEYNPESFGRVYMLYINIQVNGFPVKAFVDSGAQSTIMSPRLAQECNIMHLLDERFSGIAHGVGTAKILGRIHSVPVRVGELYLPTSFTIMENKGVEFLLGLDMLKRHQACIDLAKNVLRFGDQEVPFLQEHELPASDALQEEQDASKKEQVKKGPEIPATNASASNATEIPKKSHAESSIQTLINLGVSRDEAIAALDASNGNTDLAANLLF